MALSQIQLEAFQTVARLGSFTKAAQALNLTQPALSHRIRNLEEELESSLFIRHGTGIRLTELGTRLLQFCRVQVQAEEEFLKELQPKNKKTQALSGTLRIGGVSTLVRSAVIPAIAPLLRSHPEIRVEIVTREFRDLPRLISSGEVDFLITAKAVNAPGLSEELLGAESNVLIEDSKGSAPLDVFLDHDSDDPTTYDFLKYNGKLPSQIKRSFFDDIYGILDGVAEGLGRAVVPEHLLKGQRGLKIVRGFKPLVLPVYMYQAKQPYYTKLQTAAAEQLTNSVKQILK